MSKIIITMVLTILLATMMVPRQVGSTYIPVNPHTLSPRDVITYYSNLYGADEVVLQRMADCESDWNKNTRGDSKNGVYLARGMYQYHSETWKRHSGYMGETLDRYSYHDQSKLVAWISVNRPEALREWTSYRAIQNGGVYKFHSKLLQKDFTVTCKI